MAGLLFRNFHHGSHSLLALKRFYASHGLIQDEYADLELVKIDTVEEMCEFLTGATTLHCDAVDVDAHAEEEPLPGDMTL
jgi:hypothetical protein